jgi:hypothetical protein
VHLENSGGAARSQLRPVGSLVFASGIACQRPRPAELLLFFLFKRTADRQSLAERKAATINVGTGMRLDQFTSIPNYIERGCFVVHESSFLHIQPPNKSCPGFTAHAVPNTTQAAAAS